MSWSLLTVQLYPKLISMLFDAEMSRQTSGFHRALKLRKADKIAGKVQKPFNTSPNGPSSKQKHFVRARQYHNCGPFVDSCSALTIRRALLSPLLEYFRTCSCDFFPLTRPKRRACSSLPVQVGSFHCTIWETPSPPTTLFLIYKNHLEQPPT